MTYWESLETAADDPSPEARQRWQDDQALYAERILQAYEARDRRPFVPRFCPTELARSL
jgi:hypothetical protein